MPDWSIAVAGDSFTELGYLGYDDLFTSILARVLKVPVLNLGTSYTGPLAQLSYLRDYGIGANTKHTIIVFFEGNDLDDLADERRALDRPNETRQRGSREFRKQSSLARAINQMMRRAMSTLRRRAEPSYITAHFKSSHGQIPVTLMYTPPGRAQLSRETTNQLDDFFREYSVFGRDRRVTVWLAYMPSKRRVLHGQIAFTSAASNNLKNWQPTDLPEVISELCDRYRVRFIDLTPSLIAETNRSRQLLYNSIWDTHLNARGSLVVAQELSRHLSGQDW
jgi:hypothetical protein